MENEALALRVQEVSDRSLRNEGRIKELEKDHEALHELAKSVALLAQRMEIMDGNLSALAKSVESIKNRPAKRWEELVDRALWALAAAIMAFCLAKIGL